MGSDNSKEARYVSDYRYNYDTFDMEREQPPFVAFRKSLHAGERAPDFALQDLASGAPVHLKELWAKGPAILEFGSFT